MSGTTAPNATEFYDIDDHNAVDNDGYHDEYDEPEDHDGEWIDMSGIPEDATFEDPELACMLENLQKGKKGSSKGFQKGKKRWSKGESRNVLKLSTKEAGKGGRHENYKKVRVKLQSDRLNRGWREQPAHGTNKGRGRPQLAQVGDLFARTRCFKCGELGHLAKDCPQNKEPTTISDTFFSGMVCNDSCTVHPRNEFCADHSRDNSRAGVSRNDSRARASQDESRADDDSRNEPSANVDSRNGLCVGGDFQRDDETFFGVPKDDVTFLDVQTDCVTLPVPGSSSIFSLGSVVVVGQNHVRINVWK